MQKLLGMLWLGRKLVFSLDVLVEENFVLLIKSVRWKNKGDLERLHPSQLRMNNHYCPVKLPVVHLTAWEANKTVFVHHNLKYNPYGENRLGFLTCSISAFSSSFSGLFKNFNKCT